MKKLTLSIVGLLGLAILMSFTFPNKKKKIPAPENFSYIPSGHYITYENEKEKKVSLPGFFMSNGEVTNLQYKEFLADLGKEGRTEDLEKARIQKEKWVTEDSYSYSEPLVKTYHSHPAYDNYPVVNISKAGAELYCQWLTKKWKENTDRPKGTKDLELEFRLPKHNEWVYAAKGGHDLAPFPWGGYYVRNAKGCLLANYRRVDETKIKYNHEKKEYEVLQKGNRMGRAGELNDVSYFTSPVISYHPNDFGLYNMSGNVSEMLLEGGTKGGSWGSSGYYIQIDAEEEFPNLKGEASRYVGFRPVAIAKIK